MLSVEVSFELIFLVNIRIAVSFSSEKTLTSLLLVVTVVPVGGAGDAPVWLGEELHLPVNLDAQVG